MSEFKPVNIDLQTIECDIGNILKIGAMCQGDYMDVALGKDHTMEIYKGTHDYTVEIKKFGERVFLGDVSEAYLSVLIRDLVLGRM